VHHHATTANATTDFLAVFSLSLSEYLSLSRALFLALSFAGSLAHYSLLCMSIIFLCTNLPQTPGPTIAGIFPGCVIAHRHPASILSLALVVCLAVNLSLTLCLVLQHAATNFAFSRYILRDLCVHVFVYILKSCRCDVHKHIPIFAGLLAKIRIQKVSQHASSMVFEFLQHRGDAKLEIAQVSLVCCSELQCNTVNSRRNQTRKQR